MQSIIGQKLDTLLDLANNYPSPHNGQPMMVDKLGESELEIYFDTSRGLTATPISHLFSFITIGVFIRHFELCAEALGHTAKVNLSLPKLAEMSSANPIKAAIISLRYDTHAPNNELELLIKSRQTSRKKYTSGLSSDRQVTLSATAAEQGMNLKFIDAQHSAQAIWLNQKAVFDDMFDDAVRTELDHWLRYSSQEKTKKRDGLAYDCMELSGSMLKFIVRHYRLLRWPIVAPVLRQYYLRTMADSSTVGYVTAPFKTELESYKIGRCIIDLWFQLTKEGKYLHPFGTIVSNDQAHADFASICGLTDETESNYIVFIFRTGSSDQPVRSLRIEPTEHLIMNKEK